MEGSWRAELPAAEDRRLVRHQSQIGQDVQVGSNTVLVAPIRVGDGATIGAGSTVSREVPPGGLTLARARQVTIPGWRRPTKKAKS